MKLIILAAALVLSGCSAYPTTGDRGIDLALANPSLSHETKMNLIRRHQGQQPVFKNDRSATNYRPVVDMSQCKNCDYEKDVSQCQDIASKNTNYASNTIANAAFGAGVGAAIAAVAGLDAGIVAVGGATGGAIRGATDEMATVNNMVSRCMQGRGYIVLR